MPDGSLEEPFPRVATTDMLSMWKCTNCPAQCLPQSALASTTGTSILKCPCRPNLPSSASYFSFNADPHPTHTMVPVSAGEARLDLRSVDSAVHRYYSEGLASTTKRCYSSGQKHFLNFCAKHQLQPLPPDESTILHFVSQLGLDGLSQATIQNYLGAIRNLLISAGMDHIQLRTPRVELVIRGIRRINSQEKNKKTRLPITPRELQLLKEEWGKKPITFDHTMLWAAACTGFFGFLRCAEFTTPSIKSFNAKVNLGLQDVSVQRDKGVVSTVVLHLKVSKTDQFRKGIDVYLTRTGASLCPVSALMAYLILRGPEEGPLFRRENGQPLTRAFLVQEMRAALAAQGLDDSAYAGHSFRIGAATTALSVGISDAKIKMLGRWDSSAYQAYLRMPREELGWTCKALVARPSPS